jgi:vancomycin permeability regulator SanA
MFGDDNLSLDKYIRNKRVVLLLSALILWFMIHTTIIVIDGLNDEVKKADIAVVLGNKVELNGEPSDRLKARLDKAVELYQDGYFPYIIVSGGIGKEGFDEAKVMKNYLIQQGVPADTIKEDNQGYNTYMTAENTSNIMNQLDAESVLLITQYFHISRTKLTFKKLGFKDVYSAHAEIFEFRDIYSTIREFPAYYKYVLK